MYTNICIQKSFLVIDSWFSYDSNGVGRTGTYIAIDRCLQQADKEGVVNVWRTVYQMRTERFNMVESLVRKYICSNLFSLFQPYGPTMGETMV